MRFLIDAQLSPKLARAIEKAGHQAEHLEEVGLRDAKDGKVWDYAVQHSAIIVTKDGGFY